MARVTEAPTEEVEDGRTVVSHPGFGQVMLTRVSGRRSLYGSDFVHEGYVTLSVHGSKLHRSRGYDRPMSEAMPIVRIALSEAQFAAMVSSMGLGEGVQCTIERAGGKAIPEFPFRDSIEEHGKEADGAMDAVLAELDDLATAVAEASSGMPKGKRQLLLNRVSRARRLIGDTLPFIRENFAEDMERRREKAKMEVAGWTQRFMRATGLAQLAGEGPPIPGVAPAGHAALPGPGRDEGDGSRHDGLGEG